VIDSKKRKRTEGADQDEDEEESEPASSKRLKTSAFQEVFQLTPDEELPYVFVIPSSFDNFNILLANQSIDRQKLILQRMRATNHPSVSADNKEKMKVRSCLTIL